MAYTFTLKISTENMTLEPAALAAAGRQILVVEGELRWMLGRLATTLDLSVPRLHERGVLLEDSSGNAVGSWRFEED